MALPSHRLAMSLLVKDVRVGGWRRGRDHGACESGAEEERKTHVCCKKSKEGKRNGRRMGTPT